MIPLIHSSKADRAFHVALGAAVTLASKANVTPEHIKRTVEAFAALGVTSEMIEARIQRRLDSITASQVVSLGKIYNSLKDGMSKPEDWFDKDAAKPDAPEAKPSETKGKGAAKKKDEKAGESKPADPDGEKNPDPKADAPKQEQPKAADGSLEFQE